MKNQIDRTLLDKVSELALKEKKRKEFKSRVRVKGKIIKKGKTKKGSIKLIVQKADDKYNTVISTGLRPVVHSAVNSSLASSASLPSERSEQVCHHSVAGGVGELLTFVVIKAHKENFALAERLEVGSYVFVVGINKLRAIICTQLKQLRKMDDSRQTILPFA